MALRVSTSGNGKKSTPAIKVAVTAVALSVAVMLAAIAIVLGFKQEITNKVLGFNPPIVLRVNPSLSNDEYLVNLSPELKNLLDSSPFITSYSVSASVPAIFKTADDFKGIYLRSAADDQVAEFIGSQLEAGKLPNFKEDSTAIVISSMAADQLFLNAGDTLSTFFITDRVLVKPLVISGIFNSHFGTYDDLFAYGPLPLVQEVGQLAPQQGTYVNIYVDDFNQVNDYALDLRHTLDQAYATGQIDRYYDIETALLSGANYFSWLALLDTNVIIILILMTTVALVTLISGMMILIVDKKRFIALMKALGASNRQLRKIFVWLTVRVAAIGLLIGNAIMLAVLLCQEHFHFIPLDAENYYIDFVPVRLTWQTILILNASILLITYLMLLLPSRFVASVKGTPSEIS